jgi:hypothetical protein
MKTGFRVKFIRSLPAIITGTYGDFRYGKSKTVRA